LSAESAVPAGRRDPEDCDAGAEARSRPERAASRSPQLRRCSCDQLGLMSHRLWLRWPYDRRSRGRRCKVFMKCCSATLLGPSSTRDRWTDADQPWRARWWQRAYAPTLWQATVVVRPMRQHSCHRRATGSILGTNSRATQRAGELAAADPAYRARLARRLQLDARSRPETLLGGAPFGHALERALVRGKLVGCGAIQRDVRRLCDAQRTTPSANTRARRHPVFNTLRVSVLKWAPRSAEHTD